jgi:hypothetical protein
MAYQFEDLINPRYEGRYGLSMSLTSVASRNVSLQFGEGQLEMPIDYLDIVLEEVVSRADSHFGLRLWSVYGPELEM